MTVDYDTSHAEAAYPGRKWTVRRREWPNGREYFVVGIGPAYGITVAGKGGGESKYYDRTQAQGVADELNGKAIKDTGPELIETT